MRLPSALQIKPVGFTVHAIVTTSDLELSPSRVDFGYCTVYEAIRTQVSLCNHSLLPQEFGFVGLPKVPRVVRAGGLGPGLLPRVQAPEPLPDSTLTSRHLGRGLSLAVPLLIPAAPSPPHPASLALCPPAAPSGSRVLSPPFLPGLLPASPCRAAKTRPRPGCPHSSGATPPRTPLPTHIYADTVTHTDTLTHICVHMHADTYTLISTCARMHADAHSHIYTLTYTQVLTCMQTHTHRHARTPPSHTHSSAHMITYTGAHAHVTHLHTCSHTHIHTGSHTATPRPHARPRRLPVALPSRSLGFRCGIHGLLSASLWTSSPVTGSGPSCRWKLCNSM